MRLWVKPQGRFCIRGRDGNEGISSIVRNRQFPEVINTRLPAGMTHRLQAVLELQETQAAVIRELIVDLVLDRERKIGCDAL